MLFLKSIYNRIVRATQNYVSACFPPLARQGHPRKLQAYYALDIYSIAPFNSVITLRGLRETFKFVVIVSKINQYHYHYHNIYLYNKTPICIL